MQTSLLGRFSFHRSFHQLFGQISHQYLTDQRIWLAKPLLARTELPVTDVCAQVGYRSLGSFSSLFKKRVGSPPTAWQQRSRET